MEVRGIICIGIFLIFLIGCSNSPEIEGAGEKTLNQLFKTFQQNRNQIKPVSARSILTRADIDSSGVPLLFVELATGQNGTLYKYPGFGVGETWIGVDGATLTLDKGILIASRGMGNDIMGGHTSIPEWKFIKETQSYPRSLSYLSGDNEIKIEEFECSLEKEKDVEKIEIFKIYYLTRVYTEKCQNSIMSIQNKYYIDKNHIVRKSYQFHSNVVGYLLTERIDR